MSLAYVKWFSLSLCLLLHVLFVSGTNDPIDPARFGEYHISQHTSDEYTQTYHLDLQYSPGDIGFGSPIDNAIMQVTSLAPSITRVRIVDANAQRWEVPNIVEHPSSLSKLSSSLLDVSVSEHDASFKVCRRGNGESIFESSGLVFQDRYLRLVSSLPSKANLYGLGERQTSLRIGSGQTYGFMATDQGTPDNSPLYGSHPFYLELRNGGRAHGVFVLNSNAAEVDLLDKEIVYRFVGGVFDMYFFAGDSPDAVLQQYHSLIGTPMLPPAWHLGFHQCRWGYKNVDRLQQVVDEYAKYDIPLDTMWSDIDYMDGYRIFTVDPVNFPEARMKSFIDGLHTSGRHYIPIIDPGVKIDAEYRAYQTGRHAEVFVPTISKDPNEQFLVAKVWPGLVHFPDWTHNNTQTWWTDQVQEFHERVPIDGLWTDMNEASNFCDGRCLMKTKNEFGKCECEQSVVVGSEWDLPWPQNGRQALSYMRSCRQSFTHGVGLDCGSMSMAAVHADGTLEYDLHNLFGHMETVATTTALQQVRGERPVVITRSTFPGSGRYATHWLGDNYSNFYSMRRSIPGILTMNMFGISMVGADICGFGGTASTELCVRWYQLGSMYPFSRSHNTLENPGNQEAYSLPEPGRSIVRASLRRRYRLHTYMYTGLAGVHREGGAFARAMLLDYADDANTYSLDEQFMLGSSLLVCPQLYEHSTNVHCYIPEDLFYEFESGSLLQTSKAWATIDTPLSALPVFVKGGSIMPLNQVSNTVAETRRSPIDLLIALDRSGNAKGSIFADDGVSVDTVGSGEFVDILMSAETSYQDLQQARRIRVRSRVVFGSNASHVECGSVASFNVYPKCQGQVNVWHTGSGDALRDEINLPLNEPFDVIISCSDVAAAVEAA